MIILNLLLWDSVLGCKIALYRTRLSKRTIYGVEQNQVQNQMRSFLQQAAKTLNVISIDESEVIHGLPEDLVNEPLEDHRGSSGQRASPDTHSAQIA